MRSILAVLLCAISLTAHTQGGGITCKNCPPSPAVIAASNGLTDSANTVQLGGTGLTHNTTIPIRGYTLSFQKLVASHVLSQHIIGVVTVPVFGLNFTGDWNQVYDTTTGDFAIAGSGNLSEAGYSTEGSLLFHADPRGSTSTILSDNNAQGVPFALMKTDYPGRSLTLTHYTTPYQYSIINHANDTIVKVRADLVRITIGASGLSIGNTPEHGFTHLVGLADRHGASDAGFSASDSTYAQFHITNDTLDANASYNNKVLLTPTASTLSFKNGGVGTPNSVELTLNNSGYNFNCGGTTKAVVDTNGIITARSILPATTATYVIGNASQHYLSGYIDTLHTLAGSLYLGSAHLTQTTTGTGLNVDSVQTTWKGDLSGNNTAEPTVAKFNNQLPAFYLARANQTGTQLASTISDFSTAVNTQLGALNTYTTPTLAQGALGSGKPYILNTTIGVVNVLLLSITP